MDEKGQLVLPLTFAHGFLTLTTKMPLNIVATYTAQVYEKPNREEPSGISVDVEVIRPFQTFIQ